MNDSVSLDYTGSLFSRKLLVLIGVRQRDRARKPRKIIKTKSFSSKSLQEKVNEDAC